MLPLRTARESFDLRQLASSHFHPKDGYPQFQIGAWHFAYRLVTEGQTTCRASPCDRRYRLPGAT